MNELTRKQTSTIFKARSRMLKVKGNYKNGYPDLSCRLCKQHDEIQTHIPEECLAMHHNSFSKVPMHQLFSEEADTLRQVASNLQNITEKLGEIVY